MQQEPIIKPEIVAAAEAATEKPKRDRRGPYTASTGVVLKYRKVSQQLLYKAWAALKIPEVPMVYIEERDRMEPHPMEPGYIAAVNQYNNNKTHVTTLILFMRGIDVFSVPEDMIPIESDEWFEDLQGVVDLEIPKTKDGRKAAWLMYYALPDDAEQTEILTDLMILAGMVRERDVTEAIESFQREKGIENNNGAQSSS